MKNTTIKYGIIIILIIAIIAVVEILFYRQQYHPYTENAYIAGKFLKVASVINGKIKKVYISNDQQVKKGQLLFSIEPTPYKIAYNAALARLNLAKQKITSSHIAIKVAEERLYKAKIELDLLQKNTDRIIALTKQKNLPQTDADSAKTKLDAAKHSYVAATYQLKQAEFEAGELGENNPAIKLANANLKQTEYELEHTKYYAEISGLVTRFKLHGGDVIHQGEPLFVITDSKHVWVNANFKETKLIHIKVGQSATITVDMYPDKKFTGKVVSISPSSGNSYSLLPAENATGNWVKVVQRFPVKIIFEPMPKDELLRIGASCNVQISTT